MNPPSSSQHRPSSRRSSSVLCQPHQNSKRSSISVNASMLTYNSGVDSSFSTRQPPKESSPISQNCSKPMKQDGERNGFRMVEELMQALRNRMIESYKVVRGHVKGKNMLFQEGELTDLYQGMSNGLKSLEKVVEAMNKIKNQAIGSTATQGNPLLQTKTRLNTTSSQLSLIQSPDIFEPKNPPPNLLQRIQQLQQQLHAQTQSHSQQFRSLIQDHEQEMMFLQKEQMMRIESIRKSHKEEVERLMEANKKREEEGRREERMRVEERMRGVVEGVRKEGERKVEEVKKEGEEVMREAERKETEYNRVVKLLVDKLREARVMCEELNQQLQQNLIKTKTIVKRLLSTFQQQHNSSTSLKHHPQSNQHFLSLLSQKLSHLLLSPSLHLSSLHSSSSHPQAQPFITYAPPQPSMPSQYTMAIDQMFMKSSNMNNHEENDGGDEVEQREFHCYGNGDLGKVGLDCVVELLVWKGFFCEENEDNVGNLFRIARQLVPGVERNREGQENRGIERQIQRNREDPENNGGVFDPSLMVSHTLYPLIIEKIKLTLGNLCCCSQLALNSSDNLQSSLTPSFHPPVTEQFSTFQNPPSTFPPIPIIHYRNINSIQELQVSDSMLCEQEYSSGHHNLVQQSNDKGKQQSSNKGKHSRNDKSDDRNGKIDENGRDVIMVSGSFENHSPVVNYKGYETPQESESEQEEENYEGEEENCEGVDQRQEARDEQEDYDKSASFDVDMF